jgi:hypothetical protein
MLTAPVSTRTRAPLHPEDFPLTQTAIQEQPDSTVINSESPSHSTVKNEVVSDPRDAGRRDGQVLDLLSRRVYKY